MEIKIIILIVIVILGGWIAYTVHKNDSPTLKIGVITPLSGNSAYWGESTLVGIKLAQAELAEKNIDVSFVVEDGQLDPKIALNAAQKLMNIDHVDAIYSEFNPASISVSSFLKGKDTFHLYASAAVSPLEAGELNMKTYLDYEDSCRKVAQYVKDTKNIKKIGVLKLNLEIGELCLTGIKSVFGENMAIETYNAGETDFRVALKKLDAAKVDGIFHTSFESETLTSIKEMEELGINKLFIGLTETITLNAQKEYSKILEGNIFFGLPDISPDLMEKIKAANGGKDVANYSATALSYIHLVQLATALDKCGSDNACVSEFMKNASAVPEIGFEGFVNRIAKFNTSIVQWENGKFVPKN